MPNSKYAAYDAARPYFDLIREALGNLVDGEHFLLIPVHVAHPIRNNLAH